MNCTAALEPSLLRKIFTAFRAAFQTSEAAPAERTEVNETAERLLDTFGNSVLRLAYSYLHNSEDAEDILQDTLIQYLRNAPEFAGAASEKAWLLRTAANLSKNRLRYNDIRKADELDENLAAENREDLSFVWEAVRSLPHPCREVIHLYYYEGYDTAAVSKILGRKESTVRSDLRRGREKLRKILKEAYDFDTEI